MSILSYRLASRLKSKIIWYRTKFTNKHTSLKQYWVQCLVQMCQKTSKKCIFSRINGWKSGLIRSQLHVLQGISCFQDVKQCIRTYYFHLLVLGPKSEKLGQNRSPTWRYFTKITRAAFIPKQMLQQGQIFSSRGTDRDPLGHKPMASTWWTFAWKL